MNKYTGFTLIEILIVAVILGILAAIVIPQVGSASQDARFTALRDSLHTLRAQCQLYSVEHGGRTPGAPAGGGAVTAATLIDQMTLATDRAGVVMPLGTAGFDFGPYMQKFPVNPLNGKATVKILAAGDPDPDGATDAFGWIYRPDTLEFWADSTGADSFGKALVDY